MTQIIKTRLQLRRFTAAEWTANNEVLMDQEPGMELDTQLGKIGDGVTHWSSLPYSFIGVFNLAGLSDGNTILWDATNNRWNVGAPGGGGGGGIVIPDYVATVAADAPIGFWKLDDVSGTTAIDSSGNGHHGTFQGGYSLDISTGINLPGCTLFNGSSGCVNIPYASWMDFSEYSLEAWVWLLRSTTERMGFISRSYPGSGTIPYELGVATAAGTTPQIAQYNGSSWTSQAMQGNPLTKMQWTHIVGTVSSTGEANIYANGRLANTSGALGSLVAASTQDLLLGRQHNVTGTVFLSGLQACTAVYNKVLTPGQVARHYDVGSIPGWLTP